MSKTAYLRELKKEELAGRGRGINNTTPQEKSWGIMKTGAEGKKRKGRLQQFSIVLRRKRTACFDKPERGKRSLLSK